MPIKTQSTEALQRYTNTGDPYSAQQQWASWDPVQQNRAIINDSRNSRTNIMGLGEWQDYDAVVKGRGVAGYSAPEENIEQLPSGYTPDRLHKENVAYLQSQGQQLPGYAQSGGNMLPGSRASASRSLQALVAAAKARAKAQG